jgi:hyperosmotically inducible periplasmic protein
MNKKHQGIMGAALVLVTMALAGGCTHTGSEYSRSTGEKIDDRTIAKEVKSSIKDDSLLKGADIDVKSYRGDVVLSGFVDHPVQRDRASDITRGVPGVHWFQNQILVKGSSPYARMAASVTNNTAGGATYQWERGAMDYYGRPPTGVSGTSGSGQAPVHKGAGTQQ